MILDRILEHKKAELRHKQSRGYLADLKAAIRDAPPALGFAVTLDATKPPTSPSLIAEVKKLRGKKKPLSLAALRSLREEHERTILPAQILVREARGLEQQVSDLVNEAYGLTPEEVTLMWDTAPPRMPISPPAP